MTNRPRLKLGRHLLPGVLAVGLFAVLAAVFVRAPFETPAGFPSGESITANIGYTMFNLSGQQTIPGEGFLVAFETIDLVLVAALVAAVMLARREAGEGVVTALGGGESDAESESSGAAVETDGGAPSESAPDEGGER